MRPEALLIALRELFSPRLSFGPALGETLTVLWDGVEETAAWTGAGNPESQAWHLLNAAHDAMLEGMGRRGEHPGPWANAYPFVTREGGHLRLGLRTSDGWQAEVLVSAALLGHEPPST